MDNEGGKIWKKNPDKENPYIIGEMRAQFSTDGTLLELVSKELNHLAAILHVYVRGLNFM